jgi:membrane protein
VAERPSSSFGCRDGLVFGREAAQGQLVAQIQGLVGPEGAKGIQTMIQNAREASSGVIGSLIGLGTLLIGATGVFVELYDALNSIWGIQPDSRVSC